MNYEEICKQYDVENLSGADLSWADIRWANIKLGNIVVQIKGV